MAKKFNFSIPVSEKMNTGGRMEQVHRGDIEVSGTFESDLDYDFDFIKWDGSNILPLINNCTSAYSLFEMVNDATVEHLHDCRIERLQTA